MLREFIASQFKKPTGLLGIFTSNLMVKNNQKNYDRLIKDLNLQPYDKLLEIGYGPGIGIKMIAEICSTCTIHGIDFSKQMYQKATKYNQQYLDASRVQLQHGDFLNVLVAHSDYDKIFCLNVVYFWDELIGPFKKVLSLLKKGGSFHVYMADRATLLAKRAPDSVFNKYSIEQVVEGLKAAGFTAVEHYAEKGLYIKATK
jgi:cyclopropane fatty-acyl-phospholipid synthase-like methyltransferase